MEVQDMKITDIRPYENNPRFNDNSIETVANSIKLFGFKQPIVVDKDHIIIVGHTRYKAAKKLKLKTVPVLVAEDLTEEQAKAYRLADNKVGEQSLWNFDLLDVELQDITGIDMADFGFIGETPLFDNEDPMNNVREDDYEVPDTETMTAKTKRGDVYKLGDHVLMCGDSTDAKDMAKLMGSTKADISFTSPPYNAHHLDITSSAERGGRYQKCTGKKYLADNDNRTDDEYFEFLETNINLLMDNSEEVFYNIGVQAGSKRTIARLLDNFTDKFKDLLYWKKTNPMHVIADGVISSAVELIIAFGMDGSRSFKHFDDRLFHGVVEGMSASTTNEYAEIHRATFPVYLPSEIISRFTERGGVRSRLFWRYWHHNDRMRATGQDMLYDGVRTSLLRCHHRPLGAVHRQKSTESGMMVKEFHSYLKTVSGGEGDRCRYPTRLDMYGCGCQHDCNYCYAKSLLGFRDLWNPDEPRCIDKRTAVKIMDRLHPGDIIRLGGMTDPFQPIENRYRLTEWAINELNKRRIGYLIVTKSADVVKCRNLHPQLAHIQISYTHTEGMAPDGYEKASSPEERLKAAEILYNRGYDIQLRLSPLVPEYIDLDKVINSPVDKILVEFLRINPFIEKTMPYLNTSKWTVKDGSYRHLPLERKKEIIAPVIVSGKRVTVCEDVPEHYEYWRTHVNPNYDDCCDLRVVG